MTLRQVCDLGDVPYAPLSVLRSQPSVEVFVTLGGVTTVDLVRTIETALSARLDPEDLRAIIGAYHRCCAELVERNGGFVAKYMATACSPISAIRERMNTTPSAPSGQGLLWIKRTLVSLLGTGTAKRRPTSIFEEEPGRAGSGQAAHL